jgi:hypothetical protein
MGGDAASPRQTCLTCFPPGKDRKMMSAWAATAAVEAAHSALVPASASSKLAFWMSLATRRPECFVAIFRHIGPPMTPRPMKPMVGSAFIVINPSTCRH